MDSSTTYLAMLQQLLQLVEADLTGPIDQAAELISRAFEKGGMLHAFGTGHSHVIALELFYRAGGFANINPILIPALMLHESASDSSQKERSPLDASAVFAQHNISDRDVLMLISNSGGNQATIDMARTAREAGVPVIALTSLAHAQSQQARTHSEKLHEIADITLDNHGQPGDASVTIADTELRMGPTSTVINAAIVNALAIKCAEKMRARNVEPAVFTSANIAGGDEHNQELIRQFQGRVTAL